MRLAQISDTHLSCDFPARTADLERCVSQINALDPLPDVVVHTGDISHDGLPEQYAIARKLLDRLRVPCFVLTGNRDRREALIAAFFDGAYPRPGFPFVQYAVDRFPVRMLCLDTLSEASNKGDLCQQRLDDLEQMLAAAPERPTAIFMHHPTFEVAAAPEPFQFVSRQAAAAFQSVIARHGSVCGVYCGHVHRQATAQIGSVPAVVMTAVALDLRMGRQEPTTTDTPLFRLHEIEPEKPVRAIESLIAKPS